MFLTKEEAKQHIQNNRHHYSAKAHTYAMTASRAPKVKRLINILLSFDFEQFVKGNKNGEEGKEG